MAEQNVPRHLVTADGEGASHDDQAPAWTYDSWFAGWYATPREPQEQPAPALAD